MKFVKLFTAGAILVVAATADSEVAAYKRGYEDGIRAVKIQVKNNGMKARKIEVEGRYTVEVPTKDMTTAEISYLEYLATHDGYEPKVLRDRIFFGQYDRLPDAKEVARRISSAYNVKANPVALKRSKEYWTDPMLVEDLYNAFVADAKKNGEPVWKQYLYIESSKPKISTVRKRYFRLKYPKTQAYKYDYKKSKVPKYSRYFSDYKIIRGKNRYRLGRVVTTDKGEKFVKVYNSNLFYSLDDVELGR